MNTQEFLQSGGRIVRQRKGRRVITIAYEYQQKGDLIVYGATIFRKEHPTEQWSKAGQRQIAIDRFIRSPVFVYRPKGCPRFAGREMDHFVRKCLLVHGCQSKYEQVSAQIRAYLDARVRQRPPTRSTPLSEFLDETFDAATQEEIQVELERARSAG